MSTVESPTEGTEKPSAGAAWIERFLLPRLLERFGPARRLDCLQIGEDLAETIRLRELGHHCEMIALDSAVKMPVSSASFDLVFTGRFPALARQKQERIELARELFRILRPGGSLLLVFGNRRCPVDLSRNGPLLHGPQAASCLSAAEAQEIFTAAAGFSGIRFLSVNGHFGWNRLPRWLRPLGHFADCYWRFVVTPARRWLYTSFFNPMLILWINKD
jgi:SAM-dependent methyltransferase